MTPEDRLMEAARRLSDAEVSVPAFAAVRRRRGRVQRAVLAVVALVILGPSAMLAADSTRDQRVATNEETTAPQPAGAVVFETWRYTLGFLPDGLRHAGSVIDSAGRIDHFDESPGAEPWERSDSRTLVISIGFGPMSDDELRQTVGRQGTAISVNGRDGVLLTGGKALQWQYSDEVQAFMSGSVTSDELLRTAEGLRLRNGPVGQPEACSAAWFDTKLLTWRVGLEIAREQRLGWEEHAREVSSSVQAVENECIGRFAAEVTNVLTKDTLDNIGDWALVATHPQGPGYTGDPALLDSAITEIDTVLAALYGPPPRGRTDNGVEMVAAADLVRLHGGAALSSAPVLEFGGEPATKALIALRQPPGASPECVRQVVLMADVVQGGSGAATIDVWQSLETSAAGIRDGQSLGGQVIANGSARVQTLLFGDRSRLEVDITRVWKHWAEREREPLVVVLEVAIGGSGHHNAVVRLAALESGRGPRTIWKHEC